ncbi:serine/threonine protein kinase [Myxococcota bacterium]|nr:serine/threonine protein kinase [Myxococcota bacterium]
MGTPTDAFPRPYGKYELLERLGEGGMAEVFRARLAGAAGFEKIVAIKRIHPHLARRRAVKEMFVAEAKLSAEVQHKNVVQVFELQELAVGELFLVMELVRGTDLRRLLKVAAQRGLRVPPWLSVHVVIEVLEGLAYVHELTDADGRRRNVVHRDVSPSNVFVSNLGEIKLGDFGIAKDATVQSMTETGQLKGKVPYMSPEQLNGAPLDERTDVFSAAVVLWECLAQARLFGGRSDLTAMRLICDEAARRAPSSAGHGDVPAALDAIVLAALAVDRDRRTRTARELQSALLDVLPDLAKSVRATDVRRAVEELLGTSKEAPRLATLAVGIEHGFADEDTEVDPPNVAETAPARRMIDTTSGARALDAMLDALEAQPAIDAPKVVVGTREERPRERAGAAPPMTKGGISDLEITFEAEETPEAPPSTPILAPPLDARPDWLVTNAESELAPEVSSRAGGFSPHRAALEHGAAGSYAGQHPFTLRDARGVIHGPHAFDDVVAMLRAEANRALAGAEISADGRSFVPVATFAALTGMEGLLHDHKQRVVVRAPASVGYLDERSMISVLASIGGERRTGKLYVLPEGLKRAVHREVHVVDGAPTWVYASDEHLQLPDVLVAKKLVPRALVAELVHEALATRRSLDDLVASRLQIGRSRTMVMKERMLDMVRWRLGRFVFDPTERPDPTPPFARSLTTLVPELVQRGLSLEELHASVGDAVDAKIEAARGLEGNLDELGFTTAQKDAALRIARSKRLGAQLRITPAEEKTLLAVTLVLVELGLFTIR